MALYGLASMVFLGCLGLFFLKLLFSGNGNYQTYSNNSGNINSSCNFRTESTQYTPEKTYRYIRVRQLAPKTTYAEYWEFIDGKKGSVGGSRSYQGNLMNWSETMVTVDFNDFVRTYDVNGHVISQYKKNKF